MICEKPKMRSIDRSLSLSRSLLFFLQSDANDCLATDWQFEKRIASLNQSMLFVGLSVLSLLHIISHRSNCSTHHCSRQDAHVDRDDLWLFHPLEMKCWLPPCRVLVVVPVYFGRSLVLPIDILILCPLQFDLYRREWKGRLVLFDLVETEDFIRVFVGLLSFPIE